MANGFPDSVRFLDELERALRAVRPDLQVLRYDKGNASVVASEDLLERMSREVQAVVTAYGH